MRSSLLRSIGSVLIALIFATFFEADLFLRNFVARNLRMLQVADTVNSYDQDDIMLTAPNFPKFAPKLLVFNGKKFKAYGLVKRDVEYWDNMKYTYRYIDAVPLLVHALKTTFPGRFEPGQPVFELLFSDADSSHSDCVNKPCPVEHFAPMILFGSTPKDQTVFPTLRSFPHPVFTTCLYHYKVRGSESCDWPQKADETLNWDELINTIIWRGADWPFLHYVDRFAFEGPLRIKERLGNTWQKAPNRVIMDELSADLFSQFGPRWRGALLSARADQHNVTTPWIDSRFVGGMYDDIHADLEAKGVRVTGDRMNAANMSKYRFQIDYGGGGGTTWEGTLTKMLMPGVLFHHETPNKDWYFDDLVPFEHYVPVKWDLSDLRSKYLLALEEPEKMKKISAAASKQAKYMMSAEYMQKVYEELFQDYLGKLVDAYVPSGESWKDTMQTYDDNGFDLYSIATCEGIKCQMECRKGKKLPVRFMNPGHQPTSPKRSHESMRVAHADQAAANPLELDQSNTRTIPDVNADVKILRRLNHGDERSPQQNAPPQQGYNVPLNHAGTVPQRAPAQGHVTSQDEVADDEEDDEEEEEGDYEYEEEGDDGYEDDEEEDEEEEEKIDIEVVDVRLPPQQPQQQAQSSYVV